MQFSPTKKQNYETQISVNEIAVLKHVGHNSFVR